MRFNFLGGIFATMSSFLGAFGLLMISTPTLASNPVLGAPAVSTYQQVYAVSNFPGAMTIKAPLFYPLISGADVNNGMAPGCCSDDAELVKALETGDAALNPSPGEGLLCIALVLGMGLAAKFRTLVV